MLFADEEIKVAEKIYPKELWKDKLIGQSEALQQVDRSLQHKRFPHFSILSGSPGSGQLLLGLHIAQSLLCSSNQSPCGICSNCYKVNHLIHPDLNYTFPLIGSGEVCVDYYNEFRSAIKENAFLSVQNWIKHFDAENKQININVAETRSIIDKLSFTPYESSCNVLLIWLPEYLGKESNILLKLLEEPPAQSYIIMVTEDYNSLLSTVRSRSQMFRLKPIPIEHIADYLCGLTKISKSNALELAIASESNISLCLDWINSETIHSMELVKMMFQSAYSGSPLAYLEWIEQFASLSRDQQKQYFSFLLSMISLCIRIKNQSLTVKEGGVAIIDYARKISTSLNTQDIDNLIIMLDECIFGLQRNANIRILLLDFMIKLSRLIRKA